MKFAHTADIHLNKNYEQALKALRYCADVAIEEGCDLFIVAGDLHDAEMMMNGSYPVYQVMQILQDLVKHMNVVIVKGNHDAPGSLTPYGFIRDEYFVEVFEQPGTFRNVNNDGETYIVSCIPYPTKAGLAAQYGKSRAELTSAASDLMKSIIMDMRIDEPGTPHILVYHNTVSGCQVESGQHLYGDDIVVSAYDLELSGADYIALGHIHKAQKLGERCYYSGSPWAVDFGETDTKYVNIVTIVTYNYGKNCLPAEVEQVEIPGLRRVTVTADLTVENGAPVLSNISHDFAELLEKPTYVKLRYTVAEEQSAIVTKEHVAGMLPDFSALVLERIIQPSQTTRCQDIAHVQSLREKMQTWGTAAGVPVPETVLAKCDALEMEVAE